VGFIEDQAIDTTDCMQISYEGEKGRGDGSLDINQEEGRDYMQLMRGRRRIIAVASDPLLHATATEVLSQGYQRHNHNGNVCP